MSNPDQCVASRQKVLDNYRLVLVREDNGEVVEQIVAPVTVEKLALLLGLKWRTVQKRRQRGENWKEALNPRLKRSSDVKMR